MEIWEGGLVDMGRVWGSVRGSSLSKILNMSSIIQSIFSSTHKKYSCILNKSLRGTE